MRIWTTDDREPMMAMMIDRSMAAAPPRIGGSRRRIGARDGLGQRSVTRTSPSRVVPAGAGTS